MKAIYRAGHTFGQMVVNRPEQTGTFIATRGANVGPFTHRNEVVRYLIGLKLYGKPRGTVAGGRPRESTRSVNKFDLSTSRKLIDVDKWIDN